MRLHLRLYWVVVLLTFFSSAPAQAGSLEGLLSACRRFGTFGWGGAKIMTVYNKMPDRLQPGSYTFKPDFETAEEARHYLGRAYFSQEDYWLKYWLLDEVAKIQYLHRTTWRHLSEFVNLSMILGEIKKQVNDRATLDRIVMDQSLQLPQEISTAAARLDDIKSPYPNASLQVIEGAAIPKAWKIWRSYDYILVVRFRPGQRGAISVFNLHQSNKNDTRVGTAQYMLNLLRKTSPSEWEKVLDPGPEIGSAPHMELQVDS